MKIIALIPIKNEALTLKMCLESLRPVVDEYIIFDDNSSDESVDIARSYGAFVLSNNIKNEEIVDMSLRRQILLDEGRRHSGTHFVWLDGDEAFSSNFSKAARKCISDLLPGQKISLFWATLWKSCNQYVVGGSVYASIFKDFIVCDRPDIRFNKMFLSESRTPGPSDDIIKIPFDEGAVMHFQYVFWEKNQLKQAWYRCVELIEGSRSARRINNTYRITLDNKNIKIVDIPDEWAEGIEFPRIPERTQNSWHFKMILEFFDKYGIEFFEPLQIWHIEDLKREFIKRVGRKPKPEIFPKFIVVINDFKNLIFNRLRTVKFYERHYKKNSKISS